jgi:hypothetical protein
MSESSLSFASTQLFRNNLLGRNLKPYRIPGIFTPRGSTTYTANINDYNVIDSPGETLTNGTFSRDLYPLNEYGPTGGYKLNINFNNPPLTKDSNKGEYDPNDTQLDIINEFYIDAAFITNKYGPEGGYNSLVVIDDLQNNEKISLPYWDPPIFNPSSYSPYDILTKQNPTGSDGPLSEDSFIARLGAKTLKSSFENRISVETFKGIKGVNLLINGKPTSFNYNDFKITSPSEQRERDNEKLLSRIEGIYSPTSPIPGDYFQEINLNVPLTLQVSGAIDQANQVLSNIFGRSGTFGPIPVKTIKPSEIFLENTGNGQKSILFSTIEYNRYKPLYKDDVTSLLNNPNSVEFRASLIDSANDTINSSYYVGSRNSEPSTLNSPTNQVPVNPYGQQEQTPVYGPSEMAILYEGNRNLLNFGLDGKPTIDGGGIGGQFVWTSPKYKGNAGFKAVIGGGNGSLDKEFNQISSSYNKDQSTNITFKRGSILDNTQRLIDSADNVSGIAKLKHVGTAINQVSKVFNDGYKELTKGSRVVSYKDFTDGSEKGVEYCRVFTKDTPYYTYGDLQKTDGITTEGRRFTNSILDKTYNLNIAPIKGSDSTNIVDGKVKKYMFSIENLAWRTSSKPGFTYDDLPACEKGPNGGRIMWFPPYDIKFNDTSTPSFTPVEFMGRPEPIYTYKSTTRSGTLNFKIIVDNPSVTNLIVEKQLKGVNKERANSIMDSFFAGCVKYDIYKLGLKFNTLKRSELVTYQELLQNPRLTDEEKKGITKEIQVANIDVVTQEIKLTDNQKTIDEYIKEFGDLTFYFDNDIPKSGDENYEDTYNKYVNSGNKDKYTSNSVSAFNEAIPSSYCSKNPDFCKKQKEVGNFFNQVIEWNYSRLGNFITATNKLITDNVAEKITITFSGSASATASVDYNKKLSERRVQSVKTFLQQKDVGGIKLDQLFKDKVINVVDSSVGEETFVTPKAGTLVFDEVDCRQDITGSTQSKPNKVTPESQVYAVNAMACRKVRINLSVIPKQDKVEKKNVENPVANIDTVTIQPSKPKSTKTVVEKIKEGISKKILRNLLTECDYFEVVKESDPTIYDSIKQKIKYFNPAFHSMTPEGLNARLTFLNQCVRPGETIPVIQDGKPVYNNAQNTSFGTPPILVLRIGDFYHTKIVPTSMAFTYDPLTLDLNPEGIGVQPMIVSVSMGFNMIGGHGLAKPVEQLQNALSFNFYANTEIYDERAVATEDVTKLDKEIFNSIAESEKPATIENVENLQKNDGGSTIGEILTNIPVTGGQTGETSYQKIMDDLITTTKKYSETVVNQLEKILLSYNYGILQLTVKERLFTSGTTSGVTSTIIDTDKTNIFGNVNREKLSENIISLLKQIEIDINNELDPITSELFGKGLFTDDQKRIVKSNLVSYLSKQLGFDSGIYSILQEIVFVELELIKSIQKINLITTNTDGKILDGGIIRVYNITPTDQVSNKQNTPQPIVPTNTLEELKYDYGNFNFYLRDFDSFLYQEDIVTNTYGPNPGDFFIISDPKDFNDSEQNRRFFMVFSRILTDKNKKNDFIKTITNSSSLTSKLVNNFTEIVNDIADEYKNEIKEEEKFYNKFKKTKEYKEYTEGIETLLYPKGKVRKFTYTTVPDISKEETQKANISEIYSTTNTNTNTSTFDGKSKLDS